MVRIELTSPNLPDAARAGVPVEVIDSTTGRIFVLISNEQYQRLSNEFDPREAYPLIDQVMRDDDDQDPLLASYQPQ